MVLCASLRSAATSNGNLIVRVPVIIFDCSAIGGRAASLFIGPTMSRIRHSVFALDTQRRGIAEGILILHMSTFSHSVVFISRSTMGRKIDTLSIKPQ